MKWTPLEDHIALFFEPKIAARYLPHRTEDQIRTRRIRNNVRDDKRKLRTRIAEIQYKRLG